MSPTKVLVIGCGIAGPVIATLLKLKGYHPVVYDRLQGVVEAGISLLIQPNGLRILAQIPGLLQKLPSTRVDQFPLFSTVPGHEEELGTNDAPAEFLKEFGFSMKPVVRTEFHRILVESAEEHSVEIHWNHKLTGLEQLDDDTVRVTFDNGATDIGSFVLGCDGLHSNTRSAIFGSEKAEYTGLTQTSGIGKTPVELENSHPMAQWFGDGAHFITYRPSSNQHSWAVTRREPESKESWRTMDETAMQETKSQLLAIWTSGIPKQLIERTEKIVKYGCYDRPELKCWHNGRVVLLGDAAHPTSPHIGQGANASFEDVHELVSCLLKHNPSSESPSTTTLDLIFTEFESKRLSRTSELVKAARKGGEARVTEGVDECVKRNEVVKEFWGNREESLERYRVLYGPAPANLLS